MDETMTELEIAGLTLKALESVHLPANERHTFPDMRGYWRGRIAELEAAEKEGEKPPVAVSMEGRVACIEDYHSEMAADVARLRRDLNARIERLERITGSANVKIKRLEDRCDWHERKDGA